MGSWFEGVPEGQRNDSAARLAGRWLAKGFSPEEVEELLVLWNARNQPPLPETEVRQVARSIAAREAAKPAGEPVAEPVFAQPLSTLAFSPGGGISPPTLPTVAKNRADVGASKACRPTGTPGRMDATWRNGGGTGFS